MPRQDVRRIVEPSSGPGGRLAADVAYSFRGGGVEQEVGHDYQSLVEKFRETVRTSRSVKVQGGPPICGMIPREQREAE